MEKTDRSSNSVDATLIGAGLAHSMLAWFLLPRTSFRFRLLEARSELKSPKTWSFHASDVGEAYADIEELISKRWEGYEVRFPAYRRFLKIPYCSIRPADLERKLLPRLGDRIEFGRQVSSADELEKSAWTSEASGRFPRLEDGYQKFVGLHLRLRKPHGLTSPILMDAEIPQEDGFRFMYVLPWSETEVLIEETHYSETPDLPRAHYEREILAYARRQGWDVDVCLETEEGVLPIPLREAPTSSAEKIQLGVQGGFFHPVTGYSLPDAVRIAKKISKTSLRRQDLLQELARERDQRRSTRKFFLFLNRLMFLAANPEKRYRVFEHFYRLPESSIRRFYAGEFGLWDRILLFSGKPPVSVKSAWKVFSRPEVTA